MVSRFNQTAIPCCEMRYEKAREEIAHPVEKIIAMNPTESTPSTIPSSCHPLLNAYTTATVWR